MGIRIGAEFGKYHILSEIGHGGMGTVYLALDMSLDRRVALKVLAARLVSDESFLDQLRREAKVVASFSHPNVVHVNAFDELSGTAFIEMEYIEGGSLGQKLRREVVTLQDVVLYSHDIASALTYCHSLSAIHRDIKPSNILIDLHGRARLVDFGIAKAIAASDRGSMVSSWSGLFQGTPSYAPPEAWEGAEPATTWDLYSLGVVMYESVTGRLPYEAGTPMELVRKMATTPVVPVRELNPRLSEPLSSIIEGLLAPIASDRTGDARTILESLETCPEWASSMDDSAQTVSVPRRKVQRPGQSKSRATRLRRAWVALGTIVFLVAYLGYSVTSEMLKNGPNLTEAPSQVSEVSRRSVNRDAEDGVEALLAMNKGDLGDATVHLEAQIDDSLERQQWLVIFSGDDISEVIAFGPNTLAGYRLKAKADSDEYSVSGGWADYGDDGATVLRYGPATGTLRVQHDPLSIIGTLTRFVEQVGTTKETLVRASKPREPMTDTRFIAQLESARSAQALLYQELLPRSLPWAQRLDTVMPCFLDGDIDVPVLDGSLPRSQTELVQLMGQDSSSQFLSGPIPGVPNNTRPSLWLTVDESMAFILASVALPEATANPVFEVRIMTHFRVPIERSTVNAFRYDIVSGELRDLSGQPTPGSTGVDGEVAWQNGTVRLLIRVPLEILGSANLDDTVRWRMNAVLFDKLDTEEERPVARWGYPEEDEVWHGVKIRFETRGDES